MCLTLSTEAPPPHSTLVGLKIDISGLAGVESRSRVTATGKINEDHVLETGMQARAMLHQEREATDLG